MIFRAPKDSLHPFVMVSRSLSDNPNLSVAAKGAMLYLLARPDNWTTTIDLLAGQIGVSHNTAASILRELEQEGFITRKRVRLEGGGNWDYDTEIHETPVLPEQRTSIGAKKNAAKPEVVAQEPHIVNVHDVNVHDVNGQNVNVHDQADNTKNDVNNMELSERVLSDNSADESATGARKRASSLKTDVAAKLAAVFVEQTNIPIPKDSTARGYKRSNALWWTPLRNIAELAGNDTELASRLVRQACWHGRKERLTIVSPNSIEAIATAIYAELTRASPPGVSPCAKARYVDPYTGKVEVVNG